MMKMFAGLAIVLLVGFFSGADAIPKPEPESSQKQTAIRKPDMFSGVVEKVDAKVNVVVVKGLMDQDKKTLVFVVNDKTMILRRERVMHIENLKRMMPVRVEYKQEMNRLTALTIEIIDR
jgi:hypothetical protein